MDVFDRYAPFIQDFIYRGRWESLRAIQVAAGDVIFNTDDNLILSASTASGKTEAAFFPILTLFSEDMPTSVGALYIGPLKALINDQFSRLNELCEEGGIPVWHWHGDVSYSHKQKLLKHPSGILQITPESLESLLLHHHAMIPTLFHDLRFIVIDEIHSLMRADRGAQTLCLIERLGRMAGVDPRRIGLSATIGDPRTMEAYLSHGTRRRTVTPKIASAGLKWRLSMESFPISGGSRKDPDVLEAAASVLTGTDPETESSPVRLLVPTDQAPAAADPGIGYIFEHTRGKKSLVFVNSREECESVTTQLRSYCEANHEPDRFLIHHGNLSASLRESAEALMKDEDQALTTVTTATLELGIDIGRLERAFQIDAPFTVSSFLQRMGRTGRRGQPPEMYFVMREEAPDPRSMFAEALPWPLIQGISLIQLYLEERWVEPSRLKKMPYSLLYHQTMATLASSGELSPAALASRVLSLSPFRGIKADDYRLLLRHLLQIDHIERTETGGLIVGLEGERVIGSFHFYAVFQDNEEYTVRCQGQELGTIVMPPPVGEKIAIAGHVWVVDDVDHKKRMIYCEPVQGRVPAYFGQCPGDIHTHILERMQQVLAEELSYRYVMPQAAERLSAARLSARRSGMLENPLVPLGGQSYVLFPWLGTYAFMAMERFLKRRMARKLGIKGLTSVKPYYIQFTMTAPPESFFQALADELNEPLDPMDLIYPGEVPVFEKYDQYVPETLLKKGFAEGVLDIEGMKARIRSWAEKEIPYERHVYPGDKGFIEPV